MESFGLVGFTPIWVPFHTVFNLSYSSLFTVIRRWHVFSNTYV